RDATGHHRKRIGTAGVTETVGIIEPVQRPEPVPEPRHRVRDLLTRPIHAVDPHLVRELVAPARPRNDRAVPDHADRLQAMAGRVSGERREPYGREELPCGIEERDALQQLVDSPESITRPANEGHELELPRPPPPRPMVRTKRPPRS